MGFCAAPQPRSTTQGPECTAWPTPSSSGRWIWLPGVTNCRATRRPSSSAWAEGTPIMGDTAKILIVCTGNICRSPFIERLLQHRLDERRSGPDQAILVRSAGTSALTGWEMNDRAARQLVAYGGDPARFKARDLTPELISWSHLVLTAKRAHRGQVSAMYPNCLLYTSPSPR